MKNNPISFFLHQLEDRMPEALRPLNQEMKKASQRLVQERLETLDLVPRSEFAAQSARLDAALQRIAELEAQLQALEKNEP